jgi:hypothetical protein
LASLITWSPTTSGTDWPTANIETASTGVLGLPPVNSSSNLAPSGHINNIARVNAVNGLVQVYYEIIRRNVLNGLTYTPVFAQPTNAILVTASYITAFQTAIAAIRTAEGLTAFSFTAASSSNLNLQTTLQELRQALDTNKIRLQLSYYDIVGFWSRQDAPWLTSSNPNGGVNNATPLGSLITHSPRDLVQLFFGVFATSHVDRVVDRYRFCFSLPVPPTIKASLTSVKLQFYIKKVTATGTPDYQGLGNPDPVSAYHIGTVLPTTANAAFMNLTKLQQHFTPLVFDALNLFTLVPADFNNDNNYIMIGAKQEILGTFSDPNPAGASEFNSMGFVPEQAAVARQYETGWYYELIA